MSEHKYTSGDPESSERKVCGTLLQCRQIRVRETETGLGWFILLTRKDDLWVDWRVVEVAAIGYNDSEAGVAEFELCDDSNGRTTTRDPWQARPAIAVGMVKWDGCCQAEICDHVCSPLDLRDLLRVVAMAYHEAAKWLGDKFDCPDEMPALAALVWEASPPA